MIYFIKSPEGPIKIGTTIRLSTRLKQLAIEHGENLELLGITDGSYEVEAELHQRFSHLRYFGEWFDAADDLMDYIMSESKEWTIDLDEPRKDQGRTTVMIDRAVASKAKAVAQHLGLSVAEVVSDAARVNVDRLYAKMLRELDESIQ